MPRLKRNEMPDFKAVQTEYKRFLKGLPKWVGNTAVNFFKDSFKRQGFINTGFEKWKPRSARAKRNKGRAILVDSGRLRKSIRITRLEGLTVAVGTDVPYAQLHNEGGTVQKQVTVRAHTRRRRRGGTAQVQNHSRNMNLTIPQRQFLGASGLLNARIQFNINRSIKQIEGKL